MKKDITLFVLCFCVVAVICRAATGKEFGVSADLTYTTKYMAQGFDVGDDEPSIQPSLSLDTTIPGVKFVYWSSFPFDRNAMVFDELDFMLCASRNFMQGRWYGLSVHGYFDYFAYPHQVIGNQTNTADKLRGYKLNGGCSLPSLWRAGRVNVGASYDYFYWMPEVGDKFISGGVHILGLAFDVPVPCTEAQAMTLRVESGYHDGVFGVVKGWSHVAAVLSSPVTVSCVTISPAAGYQWSLGDTVNPENDFWMMVGCSCRW